MKFLMCDPKFYDVFYSINPWMKIENKPSNSLAIEQWNKLVELLRSLGATVEIMEGKSYLPDIVFTANAALMVGNTAYLANFTHPERRPEKELYTVWFNLNYYETTEVVDFFEGAGDALFDYNRHLFAGYGFRSSKGGLLHDMNFCSQMGSIPVHYVQLVDPYFYHLDTCFCPLKDGFALAYPPAFSEESFATIKKYMDVIEVPEQEAKKFACNAVCLGNKVVIPSGCPETKERLAQFRYEVYDTDVSEFIKAGGACKCLTLRLDEFA